MSSPLRHSHRCLRIRRRRQLLAEQLESRSLLAAVITVNSALDIGAPDDVLTLREAIEISNRTLDVSLLTPKQQAQIVGTPTDSDTDTIAFNVPGAGVHTISPTSALPAITDPVIINGYTQPDAHPNTNGRAQGDNAVLQIELNGANAGFNNGLTIIGGHSTVRGLVVNQFGFSQILLSGSGGNVIEGNFIGTTPDGVGSPPRGVDGVRTFNGSSNNRIGGTDPDDDALDGQVAARNVISGNRFGVSLYTDDNIVEGNLIGTQANGILPLPNENGVYIDGGSHNLIGGTAPSAGNVISACKSQGDASNGVLIIGSNFGPATGNIVQGNLIGTDITGASNLGNEGRGVFIQDAAANLIGGTVAGAGNIIAYNRGEGVGIQGNVSVRNSILGNSIYANKFGIDIAGEGITHNDPRDADSGPNNLQNTPVLTQADLSGAQLKISYNVPSGPTYSQYPIRVQFFKADPTDQGQTFLGDDLYEATEAGTTPTIVFTPLVALTTGDRIVATATDNFGDGNTSEFSPAVTLPDCSTVVSSPSDSGTGSMRDAMNCADATPGLNTISFNIAGSGVQTITLATALPAITDPVIIDGYTQPGAMANTNAIDDRDPAKRGLNGTLLIQLSGPAGGTPAISGLNITGSGNTVRGLVINGFANNGIAINGGDNNVVVGNYIGTDPTGMAAIGNGKWGVLINTGSADNRVGTDGDGLSDPAERNLIGGSGFGGIGITGANTDRNVVAGNLIGTNRLGTAALANANRGIDVFNGARQNRIGTNSDGLNDGAERNVLSGNGWDGVGIYGIGTSNNVIAGNYVGVDVSGTSAISNVMQGVTIFGGAPNNVIGGLLPGSGNTIAFNQQNGVTVTNPASLDNPIVGNAIFSNAHLGIDLGNDGATANDNGDLDPGADNKQNFPEISYATPSGGMLKVTYNIPSDPANSTYPFRVEFFKADADGQEGQTYLGFDTFTSADYLAGGKSVTIATAAAIKVFDKIVATATDSLPTGEPANTSEFSDNIVIASPWKNPRNRLDVNDDTHVAANDAVAVINYINAFKSGPVPPSAFIGQPFGFLDTNADGNVAPNDALDVINAINGDQEGEGEGGSDLLAADANDLLALLVYDLLAQSQRKR
jgi:hypothetical protein